MSERAKKKAAEPDPFEMEWGRHRKGALLHAWRDQKGSRVYTDDAGEQQVARYDRVSVCGLAETEGHERPSLRGRRCAKCVDLAADPREKIGAFLAGRWPKAASFRRIRMVANTKDVDRLVAALRSMENSGQIFRSALGAYDMWTARRALVEKHGRAYSVSFR